MVLLAMMLVAVIRLPERHGSSEEAARPPSGGETSHGPGGALSRSE
jgi:hypothetical protein